MSTINSKKYLNEIKQKNITVKKGGGALINPVNRYELIEHTKEDDGWGGC